MKKGSSRIFWYYLALMLPVTVLTSPKVTHPHSMADCCHKIRHSSLVSLAQQRQTENTWIRKKLLFLEILNFIIFFFPIKTIFDIDFLHNSFYIKYTFLWRCKCVINITATWLHFSLNLFVISSKLPLLTVVASCYFLGRGLTRQLFKPILAANKSFHIRNRSKMKFKVGLRPFE